MSDPKQDIYIGTDSGATTSKVGGVRGDGSTVSTKLTQRSTNRQLGPEAVVTGWVAAAADYLEQNQLQWGQVRGVGLAIPGPFQRYGVLDRSANLPASFAGWNVHGDYSKALSAKAGREVSLVVGNDGN